jgi:thioesterase domain-containing protein
MNDSESTPARAFVPPRDAFELTLARLWEEALGRGAVGVRDNFFEAGGNSLLAVRLMLNIERGTGARLSPATLFRHPTVEELAGVLRQETGLSRTILVPINAGRARRPIFFVHPIGGQVICYLDLARHLGAEQPFYGLQAVGLDGDEEPITEIGIMADRYLEEIYRFQPKGPYLLGGWSTGGVIAFEMAQRLVARGETVALLALLDVKAPVEGEAFEDEYSAWDLTEMFIGDLAAIFGNQFTPARKEDPEGVNIQKALNYALEQARSAGAIPYEITDSQIQSLLRVFIANLEAVRNYKPSTYPHRVTLFLAIDSSQPTLENPSDGWEKFALEGTDVYLTPGTHYSMMKNSHARTLAEKLNSCLINF